MASQLKTDAPRAKYTKISDSWTLAAHGSTFHLLAVKVSCRVIQYTYQSLKLVSRNICAYITSVILPPVVKQSAKLHESLSLFFFFFFLLVFNTPTANNLS